MSTESSRFHIDIPNFGRVPVQAESDWGKNNRGDITPYRPPVNTGLIPKVASRDDIAPVGDYTGRVTQYAVLKQKLVRLTNDQLQQLREKKLLIGTVSNKDGRITLGTVLSSITDNSDKHIISSDCPDATGNGEELVLLTWTEDDPNPRSFPELLFYNPDTQEIQEIQKGKQTNNFVLSSDDGGPNNPPPYPPWTAATAGPLNTQPSDFKVATAEDIQFYQQFNGQDRRPAVAVVDTGLKFHISYPEDDPENEQSPYFYRDADGVDRRFNLAYHDPTGNQCKAASANGILGYCALQSYQDGGIDEPADKIKNSPYDDCQLFEKANPKVVQDARHGSTVTALVQQHGNNAPVLPVKVFDNAGLTTLFDVLNGLNYVLHQRESANIRVVNASWICILDEPLLKEKITQLMEAGVFVVAAAGNENQTASRNLNDSMAYPACYSQELPNVITVTSVRKTYFPPALISRKGDSVISGLLAHAIEDFGLFKALETGDDLVGAILPTAGYVAVENYSTTYVNMGVVSTFGYFRSPFWTGKPIHGSSFACALAAAFVINQLSTRSDILPEQMPATQKECENVMTVARQKLLDALTGVDENLKSDYVNGGYYLAGYEVD